MAKAAEAGQAGDPSAFRDHVLGPPASSAYWLNADHVLRACTAERLEIEAIAGEGPVTLRTRLGGLESVEGRLRGVRIGAAAGTLQLALPPGPGEVSLTLAGGRVVRLTATGDTELSLAALAEGVGAAG